MATGASFEYVSTEPGIVTVTLRATTSRGATASTTVRIEAVERFVRVFPTVSITSPTSGTVLRAGETLGLAGYAQDREEGVLWGSSLVWSSNLEGSLLGTGNQLQARLTRVGTHRLALWATNSKGGTASAEVEVEVTPAVPSVQIRQPYSGQQFYSGVPIQLEATATDTLDGLAIEPGLVWNLNGESVIATGNSTWTTGLPPGAQVLAARATNSLGVSSTATVAVTVISPPPPQVTIWSPWAGAQVYDDQVITFSGYASDVLETSLPVTALSWWSDRHPQIWHGASFSTQLPELGDHLITLQVTTSRGQTATATVPIRILDKDLLPPPTLYVTSPNSSGQYFETVPISFRAVAWDVRGFDLTGEQIEWESTVSGIVGHGGQFTRTLPAGTLDLTATATDSRLKRTHVRLTLTVQPDQAIPSPSAWIYQPYSSGTYYETVPIQFAGYASDLLDGALGPDSVHWSTAGGLPFGTGLQAVCTLPPGDHEVQFRAEASRSRSVTVMVPFHVNTLAEAPPPAVGVQSPIAGTIPAGQPVCLAAHATDVIESALPGDRFRWESAAFAGPVTGNDITVPTSGLTGVYRVEVSARTSRGAVGHATGQLVLVDPQSASPPQLQILSPVSGNSVRYGSTVAFRAAAFSQSEGVLQPGNIAWLLGPEVVLSPWSEFVWTADVLGEGLVFAARATDSLGRSSISTVSLSVLPSIPRVVIGSPADGTAWYQDGPVQLMGWAADACDPALDPAAFIWRAQDGTILGQGPSVAVTLPVGVHRLEASQTSSLGVTGSAAVTITVTAPQLVFRILSPVNGASVDYYRPLEMTAEALVRGATEHPVPPEALSWWLDDTTRLGTGPSAVATVVTSGPHLLSVSANLENGPVTRTVQVLVDPGLHDACDQDDPTDRRPVKLRIEAPVECHGTFQVFEGEPVPLGATATDEIEGLLPDWATNWSSSLQGGLGAGQLIITTGLQVGLHGMTVTAATSRGVTGMTTLAVEVRPLPPSQVELRRMFPVSAGPTAPGQELGYRAALTSFVEAVPEPERLSWSLDGLDLGQGLAVRFRSPGPGTHLLEARYLDGRDRTARATEAIEVEVPSEFAPRIVQVSRLVRGPGDQVQAKDVWPPEAGVGPCVLYASDRGFRWAVSGAAGLPVTATVRFMGPAGAAAGLWTTHLDFDTASGELLRASPATPEETQPVSVSWELPCTSALIGSVFLRERSLGWSTLTAPGAVQLELHDSSGVRRGPVVVLPVVPREPTTPVLNLTLFNPPPFAPAGAYRAIIATATDAVDGLLGDGALVCTRFSRSEPPQVVGTGSLVASPVPTGWNEYQVAATNSAGTTATSSVVFIGLPAPRVEAHVVPASEWVFEGTPLDVSAVVDWGVGDSVPTTVTWWSDLQGVVGSVAQGQITSLGVGEHILYTRVEGPAGRMVETTRAISVLEPPKIEGIAIRDASGAVHPVTTGSSGSAAMHADDQAVRFIVSNASGHEVTLTFRPLAGGRLVAYEARVYANGSPTPSWTLPCTLDAAGQFTVALPEGTGQAIVELMLQPVSAPAQKAKTADCPSGGSYSVDVLLSGNGGSLGGREPGGFTGTTGQRGSPDADADGLSDWSEELCGLNPYDRDTDGDGIWDAREVAMGTDPAGADSDGDVRSDGTDPNPLEGEQEPFLLEKPQVFTHVLAPGWKSGLSACGVTQLGPPGMYWDVKTTISEPFTVCFEELVLNSDPVQWRTVQWPLPYYPEWPQVPCDGFRWSCWWGAKGLQGLMPGMVSPWSGAGPLAGLNIQSPRFTGRMRLSGKRVGLRGQGNPRITQIADAASSPRVLGPGDGYDLDGHGVVFSIDNPLDFRNLVSMRIESCFGSYPGTPFTTTGCPHLANGSQKVYLGIQEGVTALRVTLLVWDDAKGRLQAVEQRTISGVHLPNRLVDVRLPAAAGGNSVLKPDISGPVPVSAGGVVLEFARSSHPDARVRLEPQGTLPSGQTVEPLEAALSEGQNVVTIPFPENWLPIDTELLIRILSEPESGGPAKGKTARPAAASQPPAWWALISSTEPAIMLEVARTGEGPDPKVLRQRQDLNLAMAAPWNVMYPTDEGVRVTVSKLASATVVLRIVPMNVPKPAAYFINKDRASSGVEQVVLPATGQDGRETVTATLDLLDLERWFQNPPKGSYFFTIEMYSKASPRRELKYGMQSTEPIELKPAVRTHAGPPITVAACNFTDAFPDSQLATDFIKVEEFYRKVGLRLERTTQQVSRVTSATVGLEQKAYEEAYEKIRDFSLARDGEQAKQLDEVFGWALFVHRQLGDPNNPATYVDPDVLLAYTKTNVCADPEDAPAIGMALGPWGTRAKCVIFRSTRFATPLLSQKWETVAHEIGHWLLSPADVDGIGSHDLGTSLHNLMLTCGPMEGDWIALNRKQWKYLYTQYTRVLGREW